MRLILVRHAHSDPGDPDELRPLSTRGREEARALGERLAVERPDVVVASPLLRARETAAAIAKAAGIEVRIDERLAPGADADDVWARPRARARPSSRSATSRTARRSPPHSAPASATSHLPASPRSNWRERHLRARSTQVVRRRRGGARNRLRGRGRRGLRPARPERRREDDDGRDPRGLPAARRRRRVRARLRPGSKRAGVPGADRRRPAAVRAVARADRARGAPDLRRLLPAPPRRRRGDRPRRAGREAGRAGEDALRRAEAAARSRRRPRRRPRARLPRRADDRLRPGGAPERLGARSARSASWARRSC